MKVTHFGTDGFPWAHVTNFGGTTISLGSNSDTNPGLSALNFVQRITANSSNVLLNPIVNFAAGSNVLLTLDQGPLPAQAMPSNTIRIHATLTGAGTGTLTTVEEVDGNPTDNAVTKLVFPNGTLSIASHVATYTPAGGTSGSEVWLQTQTASASAQLDFTSFVNSSYIAYRIVFVDILPATDSVQFLMRVGTGAGPTYDTGNNYTYANVQSDNTGGSGTRASTGTSAFELGNAWNNTANRGGSGEIVWYNPNAGTNHPHYTQNHSRLAAGSEISSNGGGRYLSTTAVTAFRFLFSSGNITSGTIYLYGVKDS